LSIDPATIPAFSTSGRPGRLAAEQERRFLGLWQSG
jgi:hypothetical protein